MYIDRLELKTPHSIKKKTRSRKKTIILAAIIAALLLSGTAVLSNTKIFEGEDAASEIGSSMKESVQVLIRSEGKPLADKDIIGYINEVPVSKAYFNVKYNMFKLSGSETPAEDAWESLKLNAAEAEFAKDTEASWSMDKSGTWLMLKPEKIGQAQMAVGELEPGKKYTATIKEYRKKRSLDSNNYFWQLCDKIASKLNRTKEDIYIDYIKSVGVFKDFHLSREEAPTFRTAWSMLGTGWPTEEVDYQQDGNGVVIRAYYGSSRYNTKQMSRIIDMAVQDAKALGIETLTHDELARMNLEWGEKTAQADKGNRDS